MHKITAFFLLILAYTSVAEPPTLIFDKGFSWKQVFDAGFRPKHIAGGSIMCNCIEQEFYLEINGLDGNIYFNKGTLTFYFNHKEELKAVEYIGNKAINMAEGKKLSDDLTLFFGNYVTHPMRMPRYIEGNYVDATGTHSYLNAEIDNYRFRYRFLDTASAVNQLMPKFFIDENQRGRPAEPDFIPVNRKIKPPPGYEDYDMTEVRRLPDPNWRENQRKMKGESEPNHAIVREARKKALPPPSSESASRSSFWWPFCMAILFLIGVGWYIKRRCGCHSL